MLPTGVAALSSTKIIEVKIGAKDVEKLKTFSGLAVSAATAKIQLAGSAITDTAATPNPVVVVSAANAASVNR